MIDYVSQDDRCRSSYLLEYFGQNESSDCGTCDVCRSSKGKTAKPSGLAERIVNFINDEKSGRYTFEDVLLRFDSASSSDECVSVLRHLVDEGIVPPPEMK
jgi:ATP-dependent DNA helicase RecQ